MAQDCLVWAVSELNLSEGKGVRPCWRAVRGCICAADKIHTGQGMSNMQGSPELAAKVYGGAGQGNRIQSPR